MPMGATGQAARDRYLDLQTVRRRLEARFTLIPDILPGGGPARYFRLGATDTRIGFITPISQHFCETCNRVRLTVDGTLYLCLGQESSYALRPLLRDGIGDDALLDHLQTRHCPETRAPRVQRAPGEGHPIHVDDGRMMWSLPAKDVLAALNAGGDFAKTFALAMAANARRQCSRYERVRLKRARDRVLHLLICEGGPEASFTLTMPLVELAEELALEPETLYRVLRELTDEGLLERSRTHLRLVGASAGD
jgi:hypothetical protein